MRDAEFRHIVACLTLLTSLICLGAGSADGVEAPQTEVSSGAPMVKPGENAAEFESQEAYIKKLKELEDIRGGGNAPSKNEPIEIGIGERDVTIVVTDGKIVDIDTDVEEPGVAEKEGGATHIGNFGSEEETEEIAIEVDFEKETIPGFIISEITLEGTDVPRNEPLMQEIRILHEQLEAGREECLKEYSESSKAYYDQLSAIILSEKPAWWSDESDPVTYFAGEDGMLSDKEKRIMLRYAVEQLQEIAVACDDEAGDVVSPEQEPRQISKEDLYISQARELLERELRLRQDVLINARRMYIKKMQEAEAQFLVEMNELIKDVQGNMIIKIHEAMTAIFVLDEGKE
ncbi:MAG: hypothetical protein JW844_04950 [Candidatus Omnitrophica bacterium]|nr:hypothetical protein [Candidatus Omnitrophota bacterium]